MGPGARRLLQRGVQREIRAWLDRFFGAAAKSEEYARGYFPERRALAGLHHHAPAILAERDAPPDDQLWRARARGGRAEGYGRRHQSYLRGNLVVVKASLSAGGEIYRRLQGVHRPPAGLLVP